MLSSAMSFTMTAHLHRGRAAAAGGQLQVGSKSKGAAEFMGAFMPKRPSNCGRPVVQVSG
jgi:hypothetical protein